MPREATINYDQVAAIADGIKASGGKPNPRLIRERHGSGSLGTIHLLFKQWEAGQAREIEPSLSLPAPIQRSILEFMSQELTQAKAVLEIKLVDSQLEAAELASENERQASRIEGLALEVETVQSEAATLSGKVTVLEGDLEAARGEVTRERNAAEAARTELAKAMLRLEAMPRLETDLQSARETLRKVDTAREEAELKLAVANSTAGALESKLADANRHSAAIVQRLEEDKQRLEASLVEARNDLRMGSAEVGKLQGKLSAIESELIASKAEVVRERTAGDSARAAQAIKSSPKGDEKTSVKK
jgi:colicin import membrane protein